MPETPQQPEKKKAIEIPHTDVSQKEGKTTRRFVGWMIALIVLLVVVGGGVIYWQIDNYIEQSNKNKAQDLQIKALEVKKQNLEKLKPNYDKITAKGDKGISDAELILRALPDSKSYDSLIAMLERMSQEAGAKITSVSQGADEPVGGSKAPIPFSFNVTMEGSFNNIMDFLRKSEESARVMNFSTMSITGNIGAGKNSATVTMKTYYQSPANIEPTSEELK